MLPHLLLAATVVPMFNLQKVDFDAASCSSNSELRRLERAVRGDSSRQSALRLTGTVDGVITHRLDLVSPVEWNGLGLIGVSVVGGADGKPYPSVLHFAESVEQALALLSRFKLPTVAGAEAALGTRRTFKVPSGLMASAALLPDSPGSALSCEVYPKGYPKEPS